MKRYCIPFLLLCGIAFSSCDKNMVSKIPHIELAYFQPMDSFVIARNDTTYMEFKLKDGDGDIGNDTVSVIWVKDIRTDSTGISKYSFPQISAAIEDPKKGLSGICGFWPDPPSPRLDSLHQAVGDTLYYEVYITDRAGHESNHIVTEKFVVKN